MGEIIAETCWVDWNYQ